MALVFIENELCLLDGEEIIHVFERGTLSKASYKHMCAWTITNFRSKLNAEELWSNAKEAWDNLSEQNKVCVWSICEQETQNAKDISQGLLAKLAEYQGYKPVKDAFSEAIIKVLDMF
jgi:hypothetical protein